MREEVRPRLTQAELAKKIKVDQTTVSSLELGEQKRLDLAQLFAYEAACGQPPGYSLRAAGLIAEPSSPEDAIEADPRLTDEWRAALLNLYVTALARSTAARAAPAAASKKSTRKRTRARS